LLKGPGVISQALSIEGRGSACAVPQPTAATPLGKVLPNHALLNAYSWPDF
jgi:hypothetical protein